ncbi:hypothetical protein AKJ41_01500 [candidate division MSBL1 archaeon SCGC-AAA259O05]|uniref:Uncharacterized protein n=1 Tax=candidate division MSBL1 archaeon SCGC-AAA259O05 TaxID=1698271 RepID=A0A133V4S7_9EURY|nr:hypothetical protein AKJ41_01500 [candidate division MSBL1 archaeon SCGC-AAA259O05]
MLREEKRGLVLNGVALLLILPALLLSASFLTAVKIGGEGTTVKAISDKVSYMSYNYKTTLSYMEKIGVSLDNETLQKIKKAYERSTGPKSKRSK